MHPCYCTCAVKNESLALVCPLIVSMKKSQVDLFCTLPKSTQFQDPKCINDLCLPHNTWKIEWLWWVNVPGLYLLRAPFTLVLLTQGFLQLGGSDRPLITTQYTPTHDKNQQCSNNNLWYIYSLEVFYDVNSWQLFMISMYSAMVQMVIFFAVEVKFCGCKDSSAPHLSIGIFAEMCWY